jgi:hypothetical protein
VHRKIRKIPLMVNIENFFYQFMIWKSITTNNSKSDIDNIHGTVNLKKTTLKPISGNIISPVSPTFC